MSKKLIKPENLYLVKSIPGYSPNIGRLICMMNYVREVTLYSVKGLTIKELDFQMDKKSNSIGALLLHFASTEFFYQKFSFEERDMTKAERKKWEPAMELGELGRKNIKGNKLEYYTTRLNKSRNITYKLLKEKDDKWLEKEIDYGKFKSNNFHAWFHVFEDEINHRGQINLIRKRFKK